MSRDQDILKNQFLNNPGAFCPKTGNTQMEVMARTGMANPSSRVPIPGRGGASRSRKTCSKLEILKRRARVRGSGPSNHQIERVGCVTPERQDRWRGIANAGQRRPRGGRCKEEGFDELKVSPTLNDTPGPGKVIGLMGLRAVTPELEEGGRNGEGSQDGNPPAKIRQPPKKPTLGARVGKAGVKDGAKRLGRSGPSREDKRSAACPE